jgi:ankyrin repeat protein
MSQEPSGRDAKRFVRPLPSNPNLDKQRKLAKALARDYWRGESEAIERVRALHPKPPVPENFVLSDAQLVIARGYGFAGWPHMKQKIESLTKSPAELFKAAVEAGDVDHVRQLLQSHPELVAKINEPMFSFKSPAAHVARTNLELLDLLLAHGADLNARTSWEKGSFGVLDKVDPDEAAPLIARGARIDIWAAANLGMMPELAALIAGDPSLVRAKGGDSKRPLHFARTIEVARFLLEHGAEIDALDDDHDSTPAQHLIGDRPEVAGFLVAQGAQSDLLLATALGDVALVRRHLDADPGAIAMRVDQNWFPMIDTASNGGHIYQWTLGFHVSPFDVARKRGHVEALDLLLKRAGPLDRLLDALWCGDEARADAVLAADPQLVTRAPEKAVRQVADAARNNNLPTVSAMLRRGFPVAALSQHGATPLHWAAFHGNADMMAEVLRYNPPIEAQDHQFHGTAMGWLIYGALNPCGFSTGQHGGCARLLLGAGARVDEASLPIGLDAVDWVLREHFMKG